MARHVNQTPHGTSLVVVIKKGLLSQGDKTCKCCGRAFYVSHPGDYVFKKGNRWYCTYTCWRKAVK